MPSVIYVQFSQLVDTSCATQAYTSYTLFGHAHTMILVSRLECQGLWGDTDDDVVNQYCNLAYASQEDK